MEKNKFSQNIYFRLFSAFFKLGLFTFGGGMAMVPLLQDKMCKEY
jgi:chromate transporter